jgi:hypothetical protein
VIWSKLQNLRFHKVSGKHADHAVACTLTNGSKVGGIIELSFKLFREPMTLGKMLANWSSGQHLLSLI